MTRRLAYTALWITAWPLVALAAVITAIGLAAWVLIALIPPIWQFDWERP